jgi:hypothetical protein
VVSGRQHPNLAHRNSLSCDASGATYLPNSGEAVTSSDRVAPELSLSACLAEVIVLTMQRSDAHAYEATYTYNVYVYLIIST